MKNKIKIIENTPLKEYISEEHYSEVKILNLKTGEHLRYYEDPIEFIYFILNGIIQVKSTTIHGKELNYAFVESFSGLGLYNLLFNKTERSDFVAITDNTVVLSVPKKFANELLKNDKFRIFILELLAIEVYRVTKYLSTLHLNGVENYLCYVLSTYKNNEIEFKNIKVFSEMLGISRRSLFRAIKNLEESKVIKKVGNKLILLEKKELI